jgi:hypothetical protein
MGPMSNDHFVLIGVPVQADSLFGTPASVSGRRTGPAKLIHLTA